MNVLISGQYGSYNLGDEAVLFSIVHILKKILGKKITLKAMSVNPDLVFEQIGIDSIKHLTISSNSTRQLSSLINAVKGSDCVIIGGGSLLHDAIGFYKPIPRFLLPALFGILFGKKIIFYALGVGPVHAKYSINLIKLIGAKADNITVRDEESKKLLSKYGFNNVKVISDPAFLLPKCERQRVLQILETEKITKHNKKRLIGVFLRGIYRSEGESRRTIKKFSYEQIKNIAKSLENISKRTNSIPVFFSASDDLDLEMINRVSKLCSCETSIIRKFYKPPEYAGILRNMSLVITMPLHPAILAINSEIPVVAIDYDQKVRNIMKEMDLESNVISISELNALEKKVLKVWNNRNSFGKHINEYTKIYKKETFAYFKEIFLSDLLFKKRINLTYFIIAASYMAIGFIPEFLKYKIESKIKLHRK